MKNLNTKTGWLIDSVEVGRVAMFTPGPYGWGNGGLMFIGDSGGGKSAVQEQWADQYGFHCFVYDPQSMGPGMSGVIPAPLHADDGKVQFWTYPAPDVLAPFWTPKVQEGGGLFIIAEQTSADPLLAPAIANILYNKRFGSRFLGRHVRVVANCNPPEKAANGTPIPPSLANREGHWPIRSMADKWIEYERSRTGLEGLSDKAPCRKAESALAREIEKTVVGDWMPARAKVLREYEGLVGALGHPVLDAQPDADDPRSSGPWSSCRSNSALLAHLVVCDILGVSETTRYQFMRSIVGDDLAVKMAAHRSRGALPAPSDVLNGVVDWSPRGKSLDVIHVVTTRCVDEAVGKAAPTHWVDAAWNLVAEVSNVAGDVAYAGMDRLVRAGFRCPIPHLQDLATEIRQAVGR